MFISLPFGHYNAPLLPRVTQHKKQENATPPSTLVNFNFEWCLANEAAKHDDS